MPSSNFASWHAFKFLRRQVRWCGIPIFLRIFQFVVIHTVKGFSIVKEADVFLEFPSFYMIQQMLAIWSLVPLPFLNPVCTSGSSWFTILLKPHLENFKYYFASVWDEWNCSVVWAFFGIAFLRDGNENMFSSPVATADFSKFAGILNASFIASSFRIWNSSAGIPQPSLALFMAMLP